MSDDNLTLQGTPQAAGKGSALGTRPTNWLVPVSLLMLRQWSSYGYELMDRAVELGFESINPGTVYRTLRKMEKDGLCKSKWETASGGPARRMYSITNPGAAYLDLWVKSLKEYQQTMDTFLQIYKRNSGSLSHSHKQHWERVAKNMT
jgi:PadR family transcriptional regulator PadR